MRFVSAALSALTLAAAVPAFAALTTGAAAPDFTTRGANNGKIVRVDLSDELKKGPVVLYFFPAANTGGCDLQANLFGQAMPQFRRAGATVIGMSADTVPTLQKFSTEKCAGKFTVASAGPRIVREYDVALGREITDPSTGAKRAGTNRTSYVIAQDGRIVLTHSDPDPVGHIRATLDAVKKLAS